MYYRASNSRGGSNRQLHTDPDCSRLKKAKSFRPVSREQFPDAEICSHCEGTIESSGDQDNSYYNALIEASNE